VLPVLIKYLLKSAALFTFSSVPSDLIYATFILLVNTLSLNFLYDIYVPVDPTLG